MDRIGADFESAVEMMRTRLGALAYPVQIPVGAESSFKGIIDLIEMKFIVWDDEELGAKFQLLDIPSDYEDKAEHYREELLEGIAEHDIEFMDGYVHNQFFTQTEIRQAIRRATCNTGFIPVFCGASFKNIGIQSLLDGVVDYLPCPLDVPPIQGIHPKTKESIIRKADTQEALAALIFKIISDPHGKLSYVRVYSGSLRSGQQILNSTTGAKERIGRLMMVHADKRTEVKEIPAGHIGCVVGLKTARTGDTLCEPSKPIVLETMDFPEPVISVAIEPQTSAEQMKMSQALKILSDEDPTVRIKEDSDTGQMIISGMGELHLEILVDRLFREYNVRAHVGKPQVAYKETIVGSAEAEGRFIKQTGGRGQYGHVKIRVSPLSRGEGFCFVDKTKGGTIPKEFIPAVKYGCQEALSSGVLLGYPMIDVQVELLDGTYHTVDSSEVAFEIAGSIALKEAAKKAGVVLLEPVMKLEVTTPAEYLGDILGNLQTKRCRVEGMEQRANIHVIYGHVPLSEMFGYATAVRSLSQGRAGFNLEVSHYEPVEKSIQDKILEQYGVRC